MPVPDNLRFGILRARDLVELHLGARAAVTLVENFFLIDNSDSHQILSIDPRRIRYEIVIANLTVNPLDISIGSQAPVETGTSLYFRIPGNSSFMLTRDYRSDFDNVAAAVFAEAVTNALQVSVRETVLTPLPVDETP